MLAQARLHGHIGGGMLEPARPPQQHVDRQVTATIEGNRLELIETGEGRMQALLEVIDGARTSVRLLFYIFNNDAAGARVRDALVEAAMRGVEVKLLLDGFGCGNVQPSFFAGLAKAGGSFCLFHPKYGRRYLVRNHQKLAVADGRLAIIGGANIHSDYLTDQGYRHWRDLWLSVDGPAAKTACDYFDALYRWTNKSDATLRSLRRMIVRFSEHHGPLQWKFSGPLNPRNPWPRSFARDLRTARQLDVISAYFSPPRFLLRRIGQMARRGEVRIITAGKADNEATIGAARHNYARMLRNGVRMFEYQPARLHTKLMMIDDIVHIGSANFDFRSVYINLEIMLRIDDKAFAAAMHGYFRRELALSEEITPEIHAKRATLWKRFKWTLSHWLVTSMDYTVTRRLNLGSEK
ncbi:MAG: phosphatidylserine/phosphatidylglycerophosphate/cardiolipin synthase family protein [Pseudomonadota bacterium]|nr:phosphatidylserine/phosphatidylglycerophosphate/cardiolipin synthase family protein [Pseudomonadota bacterium]